MRIITHSPEETKQYGKNIPKRYKNVDVVCLYGDLGAGKTVLVKGIGSFFGISKIKSPTFALIHEYKGASKKTSMHFIHADLYRIKNHGECATLGLEEFFAMKNKFLVIEWAERAQTILPKKRLEIRIKTLHENKRKITERLIDQKMTVKQAKKLLKEYFVPKNVIKHSLQVTKVALYLAKKLKQRGEKIDLRSVHLAAMLHDLLRVCDMRNFDPKKFPYKPSKQEKVAWQKIRKKFQGMSHEEAGYQVLNSLHEPKIAKIILKHRFSTLIEDENKPETWEEKIVYYADKRVKHEKIVDLKERLRDGRQRYARTKKEHEKAKKIERKVLKLEREIFERIGEKPEVVNKL